MGETTRILGLDIGDHWMGVAVSDPGGILATPLTIIERTTEARDIQAVLDLIEKYGIGRIVAGFPVSMDGKIKEQADKVGLFVHRLSNKINIPIELRDERLTTVSAKRLMQSHPRKKTKSKKRDDAFAAAIILQGYLDEARP